VKIRLERDVLAEAVQWAARSLPVRPSVPILAGLLVRADAAGVTFSSFDYEKAAQISLKAYREDLSLRESALKLGYLTAVQFDQWARPEDMTYPLTPGKRAASTL